MSAIAALRRLSSVAFPQLAKRNYAGHAMSVPKADTSLDHVFGNNSHPVNFDFQPYSTGQNFLMGATLIGFMAMPILFLVKEDYDVCDMQSRIAIAKAAKAAAE